LPSQSCQYDCDTADLQKKGRNRPANAATRVAGVLAASMKLLAASDQREAIRIWIFLLETGLGSLERCLALLFGAKPGGDPPLSIRAERDELPPSQCRQY
jgi:hypothetical protein